MRHPRHGAPARVLCAALGELGKGALTLKAASTTMSSAPLGPSRRRYANAAAIVVTRLDPPKLLARLQQIERAFGRRRRGARWGARVLDLDIVLWDGGAYAAADVTIPHPQFRHRAFVLAPALRIAAQWRDPLTGLSLRHLHARLTHHRPRPT